MLFNPQQKYSLLSKMGYQGPLDETQMDAFMQSNPAVSAKMGQFDRALQRGFNVGGITKIQDFKKSLGIKSEEQDKTNKNTTPTEVKPIETVMEEASAPIVSAQQDPSKAISDFNTQGPVIQSQIDALQKELDTTKDPARKTAIQEQLKGLQDQYNTLSTGSTAGVNVQDANRVLEQQKLSDTAITNPTDLVEKAQVDLIEEKPGTIISQEQGKVDEIAAVDPSTIKEEDIEKAVVPEEAETSVIDATKVSDEVKKELEDLQAAKGTVSEAGTVRGQLELLMQDFEKDGTPPWASGAMRAAMATMQSRGLGASSMAGQAITQAAMESAISIASQDAQTVAAFEMQNLNNEQQTLIFKAQQRFAGMFSDQAAENAAKQFNAASENQTKQFFASLEESVARFNAAQINSIREANMNSENAMKTFNTQIKDARDRFNATNSLVIAQANAVWRQNMETVNTAAQNEANMEAAKTTNGLTAAALDQIWQRERDLMAFAFTASESTLDRNLELLLANKQIKANEKMYDKQADAANKAALGSIAATVMFGSDGGGGLFGGLF